MDVDRLFFCASCAQPVRICGSCFRGQRYCSRDCSETTRRQQQREAAARYRASPRGACCGARRQKRYRLRRSISATTVTHQGSTLLSAMAKTAPVVVAVALPRSTSAASVPGCCAVCGAPAAARAEFV
jgi:hypothetical protein